MDGGAASPRVLVVDDDPDVLASLERGLRLSGFEVATAVDGAEALRSATETRPDAIVLDINMPVLDGVSVVTALRAMDNDVPVCVLSARSSVDDRVAGLEAGADDYLVKPFAFSELVSRVRALIRRGSGSHQVVLRCGPLELDPTTRRVGLRDTPVELSPREFAVLELMLRRQGTVVARAEILDHVWGISHEEGSNVVDVYVKYLRDKIDRRFGTELIHTVRGVGYRLATAP
jgi:two-component system, OmpR family, response regulator PrrA